MNRHSVNQKPNSSKQTGQQPGRKTDGKASSQIAHHDLQQFLQTAISRKLSAGAVFLWQHIYFTAQAQHSYTNLRLHTAELMKALGITRNGLQKIRRTLVNAGLLEVHIDSRQQVWYTLLLDGTPVSDTFADKSNQENNSENNSDNDSDDSADNDSENDSENHHDERRPKNGQTKNKKANKENKKAKNEKVKPAAKGYKHNYFAQPSEDILNDNSYSKAVSTFSDTYDQGGATMLETRLQQFFHRRKQQGKTLTKAGLDALLQKLADLAAANVQAMVQIVEQSISRGWSGFYPYRAVTAAAAGNNCWGGGPQPAANYEYTKPSRIPKYDTKKEDLDFLEW